MKNKIKYHYNPETCQYEHAKINFKGVFSYVSGLFFTALVFLAGLLYIHNQVIETEREKILRTENKALEKNKPVLENDLAEIEQTLARLQEEDQTLYTKLFNSAPPEATKSPSTISKEQVLLANASGFRSLLNILNEKSSELVTQSINSNTVFADKIHVSREDLELITSIPAIQPIANPELTKLVSGFGNRINPFHKGMFHHPGIDFAAPRGTEVMATAPGKVIDTNISALQAGYGNYIEVDHGNGFITRYAHVEEIRVKRGQKVSKGTVIATVGNSGGSIAPHVHYEIMRNGEQVDPSLYMLEGLTSGEHSHLLALSKKQNQSLD